MPRILLIYDTTEGQTRKVMQSIAERMTLAGADTDVVRVGAFEPAVADYDGILVAGSVHAGRYQKPLVKWVKAHAREFGGRPSAFISVSLAVLHKDKARAAADLDAIVERFCADTGWRPGAVKHVAGALLYTRYNIFKRWIMKRIVAAAGGDVDTSKDYEYTDWIDLRAFADQFQRRFVAAA
jgi:menaquinone-dependent protoporphyrinogen oxidase